MGGLRGAVPVVLATIPLSQRDAGDATAGVQRRLRARRGLHPRAGADAAVGGAAAPACSMPRPRPRSRSSTAPLGQLDAVVLQFEVPHDSQAARRDHRRARPAARGVGQPRRARRGVVRAARRAMRMRRGDQLLLVVPRDRCARRSSSAAARGQPQGPPRGLVRRDRRSRARLSPSSRSPAERRGARLRPRSSEGVSWWWSDRRTTRPRCGRAGRAAGAGACADHGLDRRAGRGAQRGRRLHPRVRRRAHRRRRPHHVREGACRRA